MISTVFRQLHSYQQHQDYLWIKIYVDCPLMITASELSLMLGKITSWLNYDSTLTVKHFMSFRKTFMSLFWLLKLPNSPGFDHKICKMSLIRIELDMFKYLVKNSLLLREVNLALCTEMSQRIILNFKDSFLIFYPVHEAVSKLWIKVRSYSQPTIESEYSKWVKFGCQLIPRRDFISMQIFLWPSLSLSMNFNS